MKKILLTASIFSALATPAYAASSTSQEFISGLYNGAFESGGCSASPKVLYYDNPGYINELEISLSIRGTTTAGDSWIGGTVKAVSPLKMTVKRGNAETYDFNHVLAEIINPNAYISAASNGEDLQIILEDNDCENGKNFAYDINIRPQADYQTVAGTVKNSAKTGVSNAQVTFYKTNGAYVNSFYTGENGEYGAWLPKGGYVIEFASYDGKTGVYNGSVPFDKASRVVIGDKKVTVNATLDATQPAISGVAPATVAGKPGYVITGAGFGSSRGYVDLGGYATNSSTYIKSWTDTQIELVRSSTMPATSNCLRVFGKYTGYSECQGY